MDSKEKLIQIVSLSLVCLLALWVTYAGWVAGVTSAQSKLLVANTNVIFTALENFKEDTDRYPSALEFTNENLMRAYMAPLPLKEFTSKNCSASYLYDSAVSLQYHLSVCLPRGTSGLVTGWNQVH